VVESNSPKVTFNSKQMFEEVNNLSKFIPIWSEESKNPINYFVPQIEKPFMQDPD
jgi:hypothetical protein